MKERDFNFNDFAPVVKEIVHEYCKVLDITLDTAMDIFAMNKSAQRLLLTYRNGVIIFGKEDTLRLLIKVTLFRCDINDILYSLDHKDKEVLKEYYDIEL